MRGGNVPASLRPKQRQEQSGHFASATYWSDDAAGITWERPRRHGKLQAVMAVARTEPKRVDDPGRLILAASLTRTYGLSAKTRGRKTPQWATEARQGLGRHSHVVMRRAGGAGPTVSEQPAALRSW